MLTTHCRLFSFLVNKNNTLHEDWISIALKYTVTTSNCRNKYMCFIYPKLAKCHIWSRFKGILTTFILSMFANYHPVLSITCFRCIWLCLCVYYCEMPHRLSCQRWQIDNNFPVIKWQPRLCKSRNISEMRSHTMLCILMSTRQQNWGYN